jgi:hypothetical protein
MIDAESAAVTGLAESPGRMLKLKAKAGKMNHDEH